MATKRKTEIETPGEPATDPTPAAAENLTTSPSQEDVVSATAAPASKSAKQKAKAKGKAKGKAKPADSDEDGADASAAAAAPNPEPVTDGEKKRELDRQVRETAKLVGSPAALDWGHLTNPHDLAGKVNTYVDPDKDLPHPDDVDWSKVQGNKILTKQGWLLKA